MSEGKIFTIQYVENKGVGINDMFIDTVVSDAIYKVIMKRNKDGDKGWINDHIAIDINNSTHKIIFIEYYPLEFSRIKFGDYYLLEESLNTDIMHLLKYSYCIHNGCDSYYFPRLNILIWTNKGPSQPGYSIGIYAYGSRDDDGNFDDSLKKLLNCEANIKNGVMLIYNFGI